MIYQDLTENLKIQKGASQINIAIIPARGGSKRIPLKNIKEFNGTPMLTRTLDTLKRTEVFNKIIVSTDSNLIADIASKSEKIEISWRDPILAQDDANTVDVISNELEKIGCAETTNICCVYAPNPFLHVNAIKLGLSELINQKNANYVTPLTTFPFPIQRSLKFSDSGNSLSMAEPEFLMRHSQSLEPRFHETAQFWWAKAATWLERKPMQMNVIGIYTPRWMTQDIDTLEDWQQAEIRWEVLQRGELFENYEFGKANILNINHFRE